MASQSTIQLIECPRDAMQGWKHFIPTEQKIRYINSLLKVGFDTIDFGSFVSPRAVPQMADTKEVLRGLNLTGNVTNLLAIVANARGAEEAILFDEIRYLGFPFSVSPTFQLRNTNSTLEESLIRVEEIQELCLKNNKELVIYLSMGFGNPYGDEYSEEILTYWAGEIVQRNINIISLADTIGIATAKQINTALNALIPEYPATSFGVHLHSNSVNWKQKLQAAIDAGCARFDGALKGIGGCPFAMDELIGNMDSELMIAYLEEKSMINNLDKDALTESLFVAAEIFT
jgi:hydroxymethylglutaryl-CoA lyase